MSTAEGQRARRLPRQKQAQICDSGLRQDLEAAQDRFGHYRISVSTAFDDRPAGELARAPEAVLPDLAFYEGQAYAATVALERLDAGADQAAVTRTLDLLLIEQQAARRSTDFLAGLATVLARARRDKSASPDGEAPAEPDGRAQCCGRERL